MLNYRLVLRALRVASARVLLLTTALPLALACGAPAPEDESNDRPIASADSQDVELFLVALGDEGERGTEIGCGDSLVPLVYRVEVPAVDHALARLLTLEREVSVERGDTLYNALHSSNLRSEGVELSADTVVARLTGELSLGGTCDAPRVQAQLSRTLEAVTGAHHSRIYIDGAALEEKLSARGR